MNSFRIGSDVFGLTEFVEQYGYQKLVYVQTDHDKDVIFVKKSVEPAY